MKIQKTYRRVLLASCATLAVLSGSQVPAAETWNPPGPVNVIVGFTAGGPTDTLARKLSDLVAKDIPRPLIVHNKPGAAGSVAVSYLARQAPDGLNLGMLLIGAVVNQHIRKVDYDTNQLTPIIMFGTLPQGIVVRSDAPWKTAKEFFDYAKAHPNGIRFSTAGIGTAQHFSMERLGKALDVKWTHVPYKSGTEAVTAVMAGEVEAAAQTAEWSPLVKSGKLRLLTTFTENRMEEFPDIPTLREQGLDIVAPSMMGVIGPKGMRPEVVKRWHDAFAPAMKDNSFLAMLSTLGIEPALKDSQEFGEYLKMTNAFYERMARQFAQTVH